MGRIRKHATIAFAQLDDPRVADCSHLAQALWPRILARRSHTGTFPAEPKALRELVRMKALDLSGALAELVRAGVVRVADGVGEVVDFEAHLDSDERAESRRRATSATSVPKSQNTGKIGYPPESDGPINTGIADKHRNPGQINTGIADKHRNPGQINTGIADKHRNPPCTPTTSPPYGGVGGIGQGTDGAVGRMQGETPCTPQAPDPSTDADPGAGAAAGSPVGRPSAALPGDCQEQQPAGSTARRPAPVGVPMLRVLPGGAAEGDEPPPDDDGIRLLENPTPLDPDEERRLMAEIQLKAAAARERHERAKREAQR